MRTRFFATALAALLWAGAGASTNDRPVLGLLAQPADTDFGPRGTQYLIASYVKWLESAGARVAPVLAVNSSTAQLRAAFEQVGAEITASAWPVRVP